MVAGFFFIFLGLFAGGWFLIGPLHQVSWYMRIFIAILETATIAGLGISLLWDALTSKIETKIREIVQHEIDMILSGIRR